ncbi:hypothetical protein [Streptomyces mirabilis]|uniref:hypothetical protein n=1 Tax=Streptomyces mirabilis TaxID=68239 RepID=UPI0036ED1D0A
MLDGEHDRKSVPASFITALPTDEVQLRRELLGHIEDEPEDLRDIGPSSPFSSSGR